MDPTVCLLIIGVSVVSARNTMDVNRHLVQSQINPNRSLNYRNSAQDVETRYTDYRSDVNVNHEPSHSDASVRVKQPAYREHRQNNEYTYATESDHVALISEKVDTSNNIGNNENQFKLRTNAYPTERLEHEYSTESIDEHKQRAHTNIEEQTGQNRHGKSEVSARESSRARNKEDLQSHRNGNSFSKNHQSINSESGTELIPRETKHSENNGESSNINVKYDNRIYEAENQSRKPESVVVEYANHGRETENVRLMERPHTSESQSRSNGSTNRGAEESGRVPQDKDEEEIPWVWGSEPEPKSSTTDADDLDDRAAFDGSSCPKGLVKVMGICLEQH